jgi:hypothetical protein
MLRRLGVYHDGGFDKTAPLASLQTTIDRTVAAKGKDYLTRSLIVLPEAFNLKGPYGPGTERDIESDVNLYLMALGDEYGCAFVVGLIDRDIDTTRLPYSSAYLVTDSCFRRLSRKSGADSLAGELYRSCEPGWAVCDSPILYENCCVAALICMDAYDRERRERLSPSIEKLGSSSVVLCVPAKTNRCCTEALESDFPSFHVALSNSCPKDYSAKHPSIIRAQGRQQIAIQQDDTVLELGPLS